MDVIRKEKVTFLLAVVGVGTLLLSQAAYMEVFSYPVITRSTQNGITNANITYVNPLYNLFPILLIVGASLSAYGFWKSRTLIGLHMRTIAATFGIAALATTLPLPEVTHQLTTVRTNTITMDSLCRGWYTSSSISLIPIVCGI